MRKKFEWDPAQKKMVETIMETNTQKTIAYSEEAFETAVAAEVERRLAEIQATAQEDIKVIRAGAGEQVKMGVAAVKKDEKLVKEK